MVDLKLGDRFNFVSQMADLAANLFSEDTQAQPGSQHAIEHARLAFQGQGDESPPQFCHLGIICSRRSAHDAKRTAPGAKSGAHLRPI